MSNATNARKRQRSGSTDQTASKKPALFPIFSGPTKTAASLITWLPNLGNPPTCLHGTHLNPVSLPKVAAYDLDGTLITPKSGMRFPKDHEDWRFWGPDVARKVKQTHEEGYAIVVITNQYQTAKQATKKASLIAGWQQKIPLIATGLGDVPFRVLAATAKDGFRKPLTGMWDAVEEVFRKDGIILDKEASFFVGDAAGRTRDHSAADRKMAENVGIRFYTPEEYFKGEAQSLPPMKGFHPRQLPANLPLLTPSSRPLLSDPLVSEIVLFVGPPSVGKTTFFKKHFEPFQYQHVNQDILHTRPKCLQMVAEVIGKGESAVVDNTNRDVKTRAEYISLARKLNVPIRCLYFGASIELAWHNNIYRAFCVPSDHPDAGARKFIGYEAYGGFKNQLQVPEEQEGFVEVRQVNWIFDGTEEERRRWYRWLEL